MYAASVHGQTEQLRAACPLRERLHQSCRNELATANRRYDCASSPDGALPVHAGGQDHSADARLRRAESCVEEPYFHKL